MFNHFAWIDNLLSVIKQIKVINRKTVNSWSAVYVEQPRHLLPSINKSSSYMINKTWVYIYLVYLFFLNKAIHLGD